MYKRQPIEVSGLTYGTNGFYLPFKADYTVEGFSTVTWKGTGANHYIGGAGFHPDLVWLKDRDATESHRLFDSVRGAQKNLSSINTSAEWIDTTTLNSFNTDGFTLGSENAVNKNADTYVAWNWDMGANSPTGFGCVTYTGNATARSIGDVGFSPDLVWNATRSASQNKFIYDRIRGANEALRTNQTNADAPNDGFVAIEPDGFRRGSGNDTNENNVTYVDWCWNMGGTSAANTSGSINSTVICLLYTSDAADE